MGVIDYAKANPGKTAALVFGVGVLLVLLLNAGTSESAEQQDNYGTDASAYAAMAAMSGAANSQLSQMQLSAQVASLQSNNALTAQMDDNQTAFDIAKLNFETTQKADAIAGQTAMATLEVQKYTAGQTAETARLESTLKYQSANHLSDNALTLGLAADQTERQFNDIALKLGLGQQAVDRYSLETDRFISTNEKDVAIRGFASADAATAAALKQALDKQAKDLAAVTTNANRDITVAASNNSTKITLSNNQVKSEAAKQKSAYELANLNAANALKQSKSNDAAQLALEKLKSNTTLSSKEMDTEIARTNAYNNVLSSWLKSGDRKSSSFVYTDPITGKTTLSGSSISQPALRPDGTWGTTADTKTLLKK